jgi:hypothetical protein
MRAKHPPVRSVIPERALHGPAERINDVGKKRPRLRGDVCFNHLTCPYVTAVGAPRWRRGNGETRQMPQNAAGRTSKRASVDLPAPLGPMIPTTSPASKAIPSRLPRRLAADGTPASRPTRSGSAVEATSAGRPPLPGATRPLTGPAVPELSSTGALFDAPPPSSPQERLHRSIRRSAAGGPLYKPTRPIAN